MLDNYEILPNGVIHQKKIVNKLPDYDKKYVDDRYNSYGEKGMQMAYLRLGYLMGGINSSISSILDVGYGNGDFMKAAKSLISEVHGFDVSNYPVPDNCTKVDNMFTNEYDVVCFFDSLEHFEKIDFVKDLKTEFIYISLPFCHNISDKWFKDWKHRREDEHLWHFNDKSLVTFMKEQGYECLILSNVEDNIRGLLNGKANILTGIFQKIDEA